MTEQEPDSERCWCEGCSRLTWFVVRLPDPLYRLVRRFRGNPFDHGTRSGQASD